VTRLTARQRQVLTMYATGRSYAEVVEALGVSRQVVSGVLERARVNLGARTTHEAIALAITYGEIHLPGHEARVHQARRQLAAAVRLLGGAA